MANNKVYGNYLMHGRTKGSRNGISTTKGYRAVGQRAKGRIVNGRYVYDYQSPGDYMQSMANAEARAKRAAEERALKNKIGFKSDYGAKNNWQQRGNEHRAANELVRDYYNKKIGDYTAEGFSKNKNGEYNVYNDTNNRWENIYARRENAEKAAKAASEKGESNNWQEVGTKTAALHNVGKKLADGTSKGARFGSSTGVSDKDIENLNNVITREHTKRQVAKGAKNDWQQQANAAASKKQSSKSSVPSKFDDDTSYTYTKSSKRIITPLVEQSRKYAKEHNVKPENPGSIDTDGLGETFHKIQKKQWEKDHGDALTPQERKQRGGGFLTKAINDAQKKGKKVTESSPWSAKPSTDAATFSKVMGVGNFLKNHAASKAERSTRIRKLKNIYEGKPATPENTNPGNRPRARQKTVGSGGTGVKVRHQQGVSTAMYNDPRYTKTDVKPNAMQNDPRYTKTVAQKRLEQIASKNNTGKNSDWQRQAQVAQVNKEAKTRQQNAQKKTNAMKNDPRYTKTDIKKKTVKNDAQQAARAQAKAKAKADWKERRKKLKYK